MLRDMGRRLAITVILSGIILGGMSISLQTCQARPPAKRPKSTVKKEAA